MNSCFSITTQKDEDIVIGDLEVKEGIVMMYRTLCNRSKFCGLN